MKNILISGGCGFIGSHLVDKLLQDDNNNIIVFDNLVRGREINISHHFDDPRFRFIGGDLKVYSDVNYALQNIDIVFHLGAQSNVMGSIINPDNTFETNVIGTYNILKSSVENKVSKFIFTSSREVYGEPESLPVKETSSLKSKNPYGISKIVGEYYCNLFRDLYNLDISILRLSNVYGKRDFNRVIPTWIGNAKNNKDLILYDTKKVFDFVHVDKVVDALIACMDKDTGNLPINIGSGSGTKPLELASKILKLSGGRATIQVHSGRKEEVNNYIADITLMKNILGIYPSDDPLDKLIELI